MKFTSRETRQATALRESGLHDLERDLGRPATADEVKHVQRDAERVVREAAESNPGNR